MQLYLVVWTLGLPIKGLDTEAIRPKLCTRHILFVPYGIKTGIKIPLSRTYIPYFPMVPISLYCIIPGLTFLVYITWTWLSNPCCSICIISENSISYWKISLIAENQTFGLQVTLGSRLRYNIQTASEMNADGAEMHAFQIQGEINIGWEERRRRVFSLKENTPRHQVG